MDPAFIPSVSKTASQSGLLSKQNSSVSNGTRTLSSKTPITNLSSAGVIPTFDFSASARALSIPVTTASAPTLMPEFLPEFNGYDDFKSPSGGTKKGKVLLWFRSDLRLHDNPALIKACEDASDIVPVYCFDPRQFGKTSFGFEKTGRYRAKFLIESIDDLRRALKAKNSNLIVREGRPEDVLIDLCQKTGCTKVYFHQEVTYEEQEVEKHTCSALEQAGVEVVPFWANTLYHSEDLPFAVENMPDVYTEFRELVEKDGKMRAPLEEPETIPSLPRCEEGRIPTLRDLGLSDAPVDGTGSSFISTASSFKGGEKEALLRLESYLNESRRDMSNGYTETNGHFNAQLGADFSCKISPWLALGCVSPRKILDELKRGMNFTNVMKSTTYFELVWRDFFRFITLKYGAARLKKKGVTTGSRAMSVKSAAMC